MSERVVSRPFDDTGAIAGVVDDVTLAALIEGKLDEAERTRVMRYLAANPSRIEDLSDAAAALADVDDGEVAREPGVFPIHASGWNRLAKFAAVAVIIIGGIAVLQLRSIREQRELDVAALPDQWEAQVWSPTRGTSAEMLSDSARAARIGALWVDLQIASRGGDVRSYALLANLNALVAQVSGGAVVASSLASFVQQRDQKSRDREAGTVTSAIKAVVPHQPFERAMWLENARLAAMLGENRFFSNGIPALFDSATSRDLRAALTIADPPRRQNLEQSLRRHLEEITR